VKNYFLPPIRLSSRIWWRMLWNQIHWITKLSMSIISETCVWVPYAIRYQVWQADIEVWNTQDSIFAPTLQRRDPLTLSLPPFLGDDDMSLATIGPMIVEPTSGRYAWMEWGGFNTFINHYSSNAFNNGNSHPSLNGHAVMFNYFLNENEGINTYPELPIRRI